MRTSSSTAVAIGWISLTVLLPLCLLWLWNTSGIKLEQEEPTHHILRTTSTTATNGSKHEQNRVGVADLDGEWLHNNGANKDRTFDSPECCDWGIRENKNNAPSCNVSLAQHMEWGNSSNKHHGLYTGNPNYPAMVGYNGCKCHDFVDKYEWQSPTLPPFNVSETCRMLGNRRVLYIGDSTAHEAASTLMNSFRPAGETCQTQITFALSDTLIGGNYGASNRGRRWTTAVDVVRPDIIILSVRAHIVSYRSSL